MNIQLDVLAMNTLWKKLALHKVFDNKRSNGKKISTEEVARILTINRLLHPSSKIRTIKWFSQTMLATIMDIDESVATIISPAT
jgi:ribosomal protein S25